MSEKLVIHSHVLATQIAEIAYSKGKCELWPGGCLVDYKIALDTTIEGEVKLDGRNVGNRQGAIQAYLNIVLRTNPTIVPTEY